MFFVLQSKERSDFMKSKLKSIIYAKGYTLKGVAQKIGVSEQTITNWCNNRNLKNLETIYKLCKLLEVDILDILE